MNYLSFTQSVLHHLNITSFFKKFNLIAFFLPLCFFFQNDITKPVHCHEKRCTAYGKNKCAHQPALAFAKFDQCTCSSSISKVAKSKSLSKSL